MLFTRLKPFGTGPVQGPHVRHPLHRSRCHVKRFHTGNEAREFDVIVVGSGCSGLTTAFVAAKHGLRVLVVEKTRWFGGTTAFSGGGAWIPANKHQPSIQIEDSTGEASKYLHNVLGPLYNQDLIAAFLKSGPEMVEWMEAHSKVAFKPVPLPDYHVSTPGASVGRTLLTKEFDGRVIGKLIKDVRYPLQGLSAFGTMQVDPAALPKLTNPFGSIGNLGYAIQIVSRYILDVIAWGKGTAMANGNALVGRLLASLQREGVQLWNNSAALETVLEHGRVTGLKVHHSGHTIPLRVTKGVVLASGGFGRSPEAQEYLPHEWTASAPGSTGDGKRIGLQSGGALAPKNPMNGIFAPISLLKVPGKPIRRYPHFAIDRSKPGSLIVGPDGKRFENESAPYQEFVSTMHRKGIQKAFYVGDRTHLRKYGMGMALPWPYPIWQLLRRGYLEHAPTISALADKIGVPRVNLERTIEQFNSFAATGKDLEYSRGANEYDRFYGDSSVKPNPNLGACQRGPFYALRIYPGNVSTLFGLATNTDAQVLDARGNPIAGLYAVGCDQNSVFGGAYPGGGSSIGPGMTFGYRAGLSLARSKK
ncbi:FAD binding domain-containing protein [Aspergillus pseudoustus]|uniref:FAD binding domain-containing protein n=1 Tax=Aspergillus pseudoustus TaxID=1810923 RepID=A0ABR4K5I3_9EURO